MNTAFERQGEASLVPQYRDLLQRVRAIPGVQAAGVTGRLPMDGAADGHFFIEGRRAETGNADAGYVMVSPGYLTALRIPLLRGRDLTEQDTENSQPVAIVSADMARTFWPNADPIGQRIWFDSFGNGKEHWLTIVGVAGDVRQNDLAHQTYPQAYVSYTQQQLAGLLSGATLVVRTRTDPAALAGTLRSVVRAVNPDSAPTPRTMEEVLSESLARQRFQMQILASFALLALVLAAVGLYGVLSYMVTANRAQIGIRLALGAQPALVFRMVTGRALALSCVGAALGAVGCIAVRRVLANMLFGIGPNDPFTIAAAILMLLAVAFAAAWFPARRAMRVDPMIALRDE